MHAAVISRDGELTVFDPGYSPRLMEATRRFPDRLYRFTAPPTCPPDAALSRRLAADGRISHVTRVVLSHFHPDHMAGLADFPDARILCSRAAWQDFCARKGLGAVAAGYVKGLAPPDLAERLAFVEDLKPARLRGAFAPFDEGFDLFGDGSAVLTPLPGHAQGQIGAALRCADGCDRFLIADAVWSLDALRAGAPPPWPVLRLLGRPKAYLDTMRRLAELARRNPEARLIPTHDPEAAAREAHGRD